ncbi:dephospho-CoA kinase [Fervidobacterium islandicum]|uniref:Dephospho-CoA kinase n=1 Tax=Fervidobacterium islandicum TaxID=2423 RepID=A0AAI8GDC2_FERIS|nr:dephospho-CoA kinase [Fervidobacterium islandicum]AMW33120.1 dephospho-CoA kinase [Fervidobacterium islandicum]
MVICVTGKIATGKSTVSQFFAQRGFEYINVDKLGHIAFEMNKENIKQTFGTCDRKEIAKIVFADPQKLKLLESIVHPTMMRLLKDELETRKGKDIVIEAAIKRRLGIDCCDITITVVCDKKVIKERLKERYDEDLIEEILERQSDIEPEGIVIENNSSPEELQAQLEKIYQQIKAKG